MSRIKRTKYLFFCVDDSPFLDIGLLLRGQVSITPQRQLYAVSILKGQEYPIAVDEARLLVDLSATEWLAIDSAAIDLDTLARFLEQGLVVSDGDDPILIELRNRDEALSSTQWNMYAALYHFMGRWGDVNVAAQFPATPAERDELFASNTEVIRGYIEHYGKPPPGFHTAPAALDRVELPVIDRQDGIFGALSRRKTTRDLDRDAPLSQEHLSLILYYVFGCHGILPIVGDVVALKKTSPSGGSLHPTEAYALVRNVSGVDPGLYHYDVQHHSLDRIVPLDANRAADMANEFTAGQAFARDAQVLFVMTSRFYRSFWKYQKHPRAYAVLLMDAAHLSQTFYLVCAELGLGAFVTAAINSINIERMLGLDGFLEGAIAICGCGKPAEENLTDPRFQPFVPRKPPAAT